MSLAVKVCGLTQAKDIEIANQYGARYVGFIFYPPSPRAISAEIAGSLLKHADENIDTVGVFVNPEDKELDAILSQADLDILQLHGNESPGRVADIRAKTGKRVMKALKVAEVDDVDRSHSYLPVSDLILFDAKPPKRPDALPGGNGLSFDWRILQGRNFAKPWLLAGGITIDNMIEATNLTGATAIDVSSGIEQSPGVKDSLKMRRLLENAVTLNG